MSAPASQPIGRQHFDTHRALGSAESATKNQEPLEAGNNLLEICTELENERKRHSAALIGAAQRKETINGLELESAGYKSRL